MIKKIEIISCILVLLIGSFITPLQGSEISIITNDLIYECSQLALPRWREDITPYNSNQSLHPIKLKIPDFIDLSSSDAIVSPPEYYPINGVLFSYIPGHWTDVVTDLVVTLTEDPAHDEIAYVVVNYATHQSIAYDEFESNGADMNKVEFITNPTDSVWIRDYGPHFIWHDDTLAIVDSFYYQGRSNDNFIPTLLGDDYFSIPTYDTGLTYSGGNFQPGPDRSGFITSLIYLDNPSNEGFDEELISELYQTYQGIDTLHILPQLPPSVDGTGHIDMWMYIIDEDTVIISQFEDGSNPEAIQITNNAVPYMESLGFEVFRTPAWNSNHPSVNWFTHWTYTNSFRVNNRIFIPSYGENHPRYEENDLAALTAFQNAAGPRVEIIQINCYPIIWAAGAIHCIVMQMPRYIKPEPAIHIQKPEGNEIFINGINNTISWNACDTNFIDIDKIDLYFSLDDGITFHHIITTDNQIGTYKWIPPNAFTNKALIKIVATSIDGDQTETISSEYFNIYPCNKKTYDFSENAGIFNFGYGYQVLSWDTIYKNRKPANIEIDDLKENAYEKIAFSDATGSDYDIKRYVSPSPTYQHKSTHIYEFTILEDIGSIDELTIKWEGYSDYCGYIELYIWDYLNEHWTDGKGNFGQNRYLDIWSGNRDGYLTGKIHDNIENFLDDNGQLTILLYSEHGPDGYWIAYDPTFHDYISIEIKMIIPVIEGDTNFDSEVTIEDLKNVISALGTSGLDYLGIDSDLNDDGIVDKKDIKIVFINIPIIKDIIQFLNDLINEP